MIEQVRAARTSGASAVVGRGASAGVDVGDGGFGERLMGSEVGCLRAHALRVAAGLWLLGTAASIHTLQLDLRALVTDRDPPPRTGR
jgi:hypothetical protein